MSHDGEIGVNPLDVALSAGDAVSNLAFEDDRLADVTLVIHFVHE